MLIEDRVTKYMNNKDLSTQVWWCWQACHPALGRLLQENFCKYEASLDYTLRPCLKKN